MKRLWYLYIVRCADKSLYTGITVDVVKRIETHEKGKGAKYLRAKKRKPFNLVFMIEIGDHSKALKIERAVKKLPKKQKEELISIHPSLPLLLSILS